MNKKLRKFWLLEIRKKSTTMCILIFCALFIVSLCENPIINSAVNMSAGFDFRDPTVVRDEIFVYSFAKGKTYSFPSHPSLVFKVPDQQTIRTRSSTVLESDLGIFDKYSKLIDNLLDEYHIHEGGAVSNDSYAYKELKWVREKMGKGNCSCGISELYYSHFTAVNDPYFFMTMTDAWDSDLKSLPDTVETVADKKKYYEFVYKYGTHFLEDTIFGGDVKLLICINKTVIREKPMSWVTSNLNAYYYSKVFDLDPGPYTNKSQIKIDPLFKNHTDSMMLFAGGELKFRTEDTLIPWFKSLDDTAGLINGTLTINSELVDDDKKAKSLKTIILKYIKDGPLKPLSRFFMKVT